MFSCSFLNHINYFSTDANDTAGSEKDMNAAPVAAPIPVKEDTPKESFDRANDNDLRKARNENSSLKQENIKLQVSFPIKTLPFPYSFIHYYPSNTLYHRMKIFKKNQQNL